MKTLNRSGRGKVRPSSSRRATPLVEKFEKRELLSGTGLIQGYAYLDSNGNGLLNADDAPKAGVAIDLLSSDGNTFIGQATTNSDGYYRFQDIAPGNYILEEAPGAGFTATGVQANSLFDVGTAINNGKAIAVTVVDPSALPPVTVSRNLQNPADPQTVAYTLDGGPFNSVTQSGDPVHQYELTLSGSNLASPQTIESFCTDLFHANPGQNGQTFLLNPSLTPSSPALTANIGRIGYLYNHYGTTALSSTQGAALQVAIWELLYDQAPDLTGGNYQVVAPGDGSPTDAATYAAAQDFLNISAGKDESAFFLNNSLPTDSLPSGISYTQGMIATESFDFLVKPDCHTPCPPPCPPPVCPPPVCPPPHHCPPPVCPPPVCPPPVCPPPHSCPPPVCHPSNPCGDDGHKGGSSYDDGHKHKSSCDDHNDKSSCDDGHKDKSSCDDGHKDKSSCDKGDYKGGSSCDNGGHSGGSSCGSGSVKNLGSLLKGYFRS